MCSYCERVKEILADEDENIIKLRGYLNSQTKQCLVKEIRYTTRQFSAAPSIKWSLWKYDKKQKLYWFSQEVSECPQCSKKLK